MFWTVYFPMISVLSFEAAHPMLKELIFDANVHEAFVFLNRHVDDTQSSASLITLSETLRVSGDLQLSLGRLEEAEESLRKSNRLIRHDKALLRVQSCRNTGWQAFFLNRPSTALSCFTRLLNEQELTVLNRLEALSGIIFILHALGYFNEAWQYLDEMAVLARQEGGEIWQQLAQAIRIDFTAQYTLRQSARFSDHIFWQVSIANFTAQPLSHYGEIDAMPRLLRQRIQYLLQLRHLSGGNFESAERLQNHLSWAMGAELEHYQQALRIEIALAALAADSSRLAQNSLNLNHFGQGKAQYASIRNHFEYFYCLAKASQQTGRMNEALSHYSRYALLAMQSMRAFTLPADFRQLKRTTGNPGSPLKASTQSDDFSARLPGKYRRAYNYLISNLSRPDLSVREIAAHISVTERALQLTFKTHIGLSPTEVIRRQRMERIRNALLNENGISIADVAEKWGVQNRSTLVNSYRKEFHEAPSDTLLR